MRSLIREPAVALPAVSPRKENLTPRHFNLPVHQEMLVFYRPRKREARQKESHRTVPWLAYYISNHSGEGLMASIKHKYSLRGNPGVIKSHGNRVLLAADRHSERMMWKKRLQVLHSKCSTILCYGPFCVPKSIT